jgi:hypothetical protein
VQLSLPPGSPMDARSTEFVGRVFMFCSEYAPEGGMTPCALNDCHHFSSELRTRIFRGLTKGKTMKRNLLAGLVFALAVPVAAFAAPVTQASAKKHPVVAQANTAGAAKSTPATDADGKGKKKAKKAKPSKSTGMKSDHKADQAK